MSEYYQTARGKRAISCLSDRLRKSEDIFTRDMNAQELRITNHNTKDAIKFAYLAENAPKEEDSINEAYKSSTNTTIPPELS